MHMQDGLHRLAKAAGIAIDWRDAHGASRRVTPEVLRGVLGALGFPAGTPGEIADGLAKLEADRKACPPLLTVQAGSPIVVPGAAADGLAYRVELEDGSQLSGTADAAADGHLRLPCLRMPGYHRLLLGRHELIIANAPSRCVSIADVCGDENPRLWGLAAQIYSLRRADAGVGEIGGVGDFTALARLGASVARAGCDALAISPVHAMFAADPSQYSPYAPSSRLFLNAVYADPRDVFDPAAVAAQLEALGTGPRLLELESAALVDWPEVARLRLALLRRLFDGFPENASRGSAVEFDAFRQAGGEALDDHARFEVLHAHHVASDHADWRQWPALLRDPRSSAVAAFAAARAHDVAFHAFLQWLAARGLAAAHRAATGAGMRIGLMADLAVGTSPWGSHAWSLQEDVMTGLSPGAPPDIYNAAGQAWGLTAFSPHALRRNGFSAYLEMLRSALTHAGGLRIDHALGMSRMWLVPDGAHPRDGAYVRYPFEDMMRLTALESVRRRAVIMGENLGTVPEGFNDAIARHGMLGMSVLWFERGEGTPAPFTPPTRWSGDNIATTTTHDLPTIAGWWQGRDIDWRARLGMLEHDAETNDRAARQADRQALWQAMHGKQASEAPQEPPVDDIIGHVAITASPLVLVPLEDILGEVEQPNLPGTIDTHPNWRRRLTTSVDALAQTAPAEHRLGMLAQARSDS